MIHYTAGYKYQLTEPHVYHLGQRVNDNLYPPDKQDGFGLWYWAASPFLAVYPDGEVYLFTGYAWDGASGPAIDDETNMVPALEHDGTYQLIRAGILPEDPWRKIADKNLRQGLKERGMNFFRRWYWFKSVRFAGFDAATVKRKVRTSE